MLMSPFSWYYYACYVLYFYVYNLNHKYILRIYVYDLSVKQKSAYVCDVKTFCFRLPQMQFH